MAAGPWLFVNGFRNSLFSRYINGGSALTHKCVLLASTSNISATSTTYAGVTGELPTANGYTVGGVAVTISLSGTTNLAISFASNPTFTASGADLVARWAAVVETSGNVVCYCLLDATPANYTIPNGSLLQIDSDGAPTLANLT